MRKRAENYIPKDIQEAAKEAGHKTLPRWYAGRGHKEIKLSEGLGKVVAKAREEAGLPPPRLVKPDNPASEIGIIEGNP